MFLGDRSRLMRRADNLTAMWADCQNNVEFLTFDNPIGLRGLLTGYLIFSLFTYLRDTLYISAYVYR
jgi:hypothetical protein